MGNKEETIYWKRGREGRVGEGGSGDRAKSGEGELVGQLDLNIIFVQISTSPCD